jgi:hypothetical protein
MATMTVIDEASAPKKPSPGASASLLRQAEYEGFVNSLKKGQAGKLVPSDIEKTRSLVLRVTRAGSRLGKSVEAWTVDGVVYFRVI